MRTRKPVTARQAARANVGSLAFQIEMLENQLKACQPEHRAELENKLAVLKAKNAAQWR